jgi:hypothetical protein
MTTAFALHSILNQAGEIAPGTIFDAGSDYDDLKRLGAIRDLTETEKELHQAFNTAPAAKKEKKPKEVPPKETQAETIVPKVDPISEDTKPTTPVADVDNPKLDI